MLNSYWRPSLYFDTFFEQAYELATNTILNHIENRKHILDLGAGEYPILKKIIRAKKNIVADVVDTQTIKISEPGLNFFHTAADEFLINSKKKYDVIILNAALHEIWHGQKLNFLNEFLNLIKSHLNPDGICFIGDYYYADNIDHQALAAYRKKVLKEIGHADEKERFFKSNDIITACKSLKDFELISHDEIPVAEEIERFYYALIFHRT